MSLIPTVLAACLLVFATSEANLLPHNSIRSGGHPQPVRRAPPPIALPQPACGACDLANVDLSGLTKALQDLGPALQRTTAAIGNLLNNLVSKLTDLKVAIDDVLKGIRADIGPLLDKLYTAAANIVKCPALAFLFGSLRDYLIEILDIIQKNWFPTIAEKTVQGTLDALSKTLITALPYIVALLRNVVYALLQIVGAGLCPILGSVVWELLKPNTSGTVYNLLAGVLQALGKDGLVGFLTGLLNGIGNFTNIIPTNGVSVSNPLQVITNLLCSVLSLLGIKSILGQSCADTFKIIG